MSTPSTSRPESPLLFAVVGALADLRPAELDALARRKGSADPSIEATVAQIIKRVRLEGDTALLEFAATFDGVALDSVEVPFDRCRRARDALAPGLRAALEQAAAAIRTFHSALAPRRVEIHTQPGVRLVRTVEPLGRVGVYAPGGRAAYPSSVLMGVIPARVAGVTQILVCTPPGADGLPPAEVLAACAIGGCDRVFAIGGAGAIAALAFGTASISRVDRIVGPGNAWVTEAKRQVSDVVGIDCPAGPSEILIVADETADPLRIAAELVAQAEHDPDAAVILTSTDAGLIDRVRERVAGLLDGHPRRDIAAAAIGRGGALLFAASLDEALAFASRFAPEHLMLAVRDPEHAATRVRNAGTIFLGQSSSVTFGDYITGANHVLPTAGLARSFSGLDTSDFVRRVTVQHITADAAALLAGPAGLLADAEGLPGHAFAARLHLAGSPARPAPQDSRSTSPRSGLARPRYAAVSTYDPARRPCDIDLSDNTNLFGTGESVRTAARQADDAGLACYPSVYGGALKSAFAGVLGVDARNIVTGCGSDDIIDSAIRAFCEAGDGLAHPWPTFGIVPTFARMNSVVPVAVVSADGRTPDVAGLLSSGARMLYLCRPDNPTGTLCARPIVEALVKGFPGVVLIDEAYADFAGESVLDLVMASNNAVVLRTLSKAWGLAGLRIGFAVGPAALVSEIEKSRGPYKVGALAERIALAALGEGRAHAAACVREAVANREWLAGQLERLGYRPLPSRANFLLVPVPDGRATAITEALYAKGIGVRPFASLPSLGDCIRVTIGPLAMMQAFLDALSGVGPAQVAK